MRILVLLLVVLLGLTACGDGSGGGADGSAVDRGRPCPAYAEASGPAGEAANDRFIVGFSAGSDLVDDPAARAEVLDEVGERLCLGLTESDLLAPGVVLVGSDRLLDQVGQARLTTAIERVDGVDYAEPDGIATTDATPDATSDGPLQ